MPPIYTIDKKTGLKYRSNKGELFVIKEQSQYDSLDVKDKTVLDCGANIGSFAVRALKRGAKLVHCYEPCIDTYKVLLENKREGMILHNSAIMDKAGCVEFFLSPKYPAAHSIVPTRGRESTQVSAVAFDNVLAKTKPEVIKIDVEGAEYNFIKKELPEYVVEVAIELHMRGKPGVQKAKDLLSLFSDWFVHREFRFNWHITTAVMSRTRETDTLVKDLI